MPPIFQCWWNFSIAEDEILFVFLTFIFVLGITWFVWVVLLERAKGQRPLPPGPRGLPLVGILPFLDPELHSYFASLAETYGPILSLRLGGKVGVVISSPAIAREVLKEQDVTFANRDVPLVVTAMEYGGRDIVFTPYGAEWRMLRKVCVRDMLGHATLDAFYSYRRQEIRNMTRFLYNQSGIPVDIGEQMFKTVLNVITSMLWGGSIQGREGATVGVEFREAVNEMTKLLGSPNVSDFFPWLAWLDLQGMRRQMKVVSTKFEHIFDKVIALVRAQIEANNENTIGNTGKKDFLQVLLQLKNAADSKTPLTMDHVKALLMDMVVGGTETTSNTVEFAMAEMMNKPETIKKAQKELDEVVGKSNNGVEECHIQKLPFLQAVMKEVLRLHPVLPLMVPHCPSESSVVGNYTIPKGSRVFVNVWAIHRDPSIWENPLTFLPERFLNNNNNNGKVVGDYSGNDFNYLPFGSGRRMCAGMTMAERMVMFSLASLLYYFEWKLPATAGHHDEELDLSEKFGIVLKKKKPLIAIPTPRFSDTGRSYE